LLHRGDIAGAQSLYRSTTRSLILLAVPVYVLLAMFAPLALDLLGPGFESAAVPLAVLCAGAIVSFCAGPVHSVLIMGGRSGLAAANKAVVLALNVALDIVLVPTLGLLGAAIAWSACMVLDCALAAWQVRRVHGISLDARHVIAPFVVAAGCTVLPATAALALGGGYVVALLATIIAAAGIAAISRAARWIPRRRASTTENS
jgi:O-antigen/teichoic acid export membrane protein